MTRTSAVRPWPALAMAGLFLLVGSASTSADSSPGPGGTSYEQPDVSELRCDTGTDGSCPRGEKLLVKGDGLAATKAVTFLGGPGARDDRSARPRERSARRVTVSVPRGARSGPVAVQTTTATITGPRLRVLAAEPKAKSPASPTPAAAGGGVFPVDGKHDYGTEVNRFGGGRGHQGQDVFAECGTRMVAALAGEVTVAEFEGNAGNHVVVEAADGTSQAYMHLVAPASVKEGEKVTAGQPIGEVGQTGRASGCHLHFEMWEGSWQTGGTPIDPRPLLKRWDAAT